MKQDRLSEYRQLLDEAMLVLDEGSVFNSKKKCWEPSQEAIRQSKYCVQQALHVLGKIGSMPKHGKNRRAA